MSTQDETADKLFGNTETPAQQPQRAAMFGPDPDAAAERLFGSSVHASTKFYEAPDLLQPAEAINAANEAWRGALRALSLSELEGREITELVRRYGEAPPDAATVAQWERETSENLERRYGPQEARERLATARALATRDQRFIGELNAAGLGSHPRVVELLAERAHSLRLRGKL